MPQRSANALLIALFLIAASAISTGANAQKVYKCGSAYSQQPCPGGISIDASDSRTNADKARMDATTLQTARAANQMEKERLVQEEKNLAAQRMSMPPTGAVSAPVPKDETSEVIQQPKLAKPQKLQAFTAQAPSTSKPTKPSKSKTKKKKAKPVAATTATNL